MTTENLRNTLATAEAMKTANKELKKQYGKIDINKLEDIHYEMEDLIESANEIQESMSRTYGVPDELDEADLQAGECARSEAASACFLLRKSVRCDIEADLDDAERNDIATSTELDALEDDLAYESIAGESEAIPSYLRDDIHEPLPDLVDEQPAEVSRSVWRYRE